MLSEENMGINITLTMVSEIVDQSVGQFIFDVVHVFHGVVGCIMLSFMMDAVGVFVGGVWVVVGFFVLVRVMFHGSEVAMNVPEARAMVAFWVRGSKQTMHQVANSVLIKVLRSVMFSCKVISFGLGVLLESFLLRFILVRRHPVLMFCSGVVMTWCMGVVSLIVIAMRSVVHDFSRNSVVLLVG